MVGAVHGHGPAGGLLDGGPATLPLEGADDDGEPEAGDLPPERRLERPRALAGGQVDHQHHGEVALEDGHRRVLEVGPVAEQDARDHGHDAGPVRAEGRHRDAHAVIRSPARRRRASSMPKWWATSCTTVVRTWCTTSSSVRQHGQDRETVDRDAVGHDQAAVVGPGGERYPLVEAEQAGPRAVARPGPRRCPCAARGPRGCRRGPPPPAPRTPRPGRRSRRPSGGGRSAHPRNCHTPSLLSRGWRCRPCYVA